MLGLADHHRRAVGAMFLRRDGRATLSVPGGTTPGPVFDTLSGVDLDWANVAVFLNDERWVGEDSPRSNTRLLRERLLRGRAAAGAAGAALRAGAGSRKTRWPAWPTGLRPHLPISVLLLGMGARHAHGQPVSRRRPAGRGSGARCAGPDGDAGRGGGRAAHHPDRAGAAGGAAHPYPDHRRGKARGAGARAAADRRWRHPCGLVLDNATVHWAE